jgi:hypothetical protein
MKRLDCSGLSGLGLGFAATGGSGAGMSSIVKAALILSAAILLGCFLLGGIYTTGRLAAGPGIFVVNKFSGAVTICGAGFCRHQIKGDEANPYSQFAPANPNAPPGSEDAPATPAPAQR